MLEQNLLVLRSAIENLKLCNLNYVNFKLNLNLFINGRNIRFNFFKNEFIKINKR